MRHSSPFIHHSRDQALCLVFAHVYAPTVGERELCEFGMTT